MKGRPDLTAALLRVYAVSLAADGWGMLAARVLAYAAAVEHAPPSAAHGDALQRAGWVDASHRLTPSGRAVLAQALDEQTLDERVLA